MFFDDTGYRILGTTDYAKLFLWIPKLLFQMVQIWPRTEHFRIKTLISTILSVSLMVFIAVGLYKDMEFDINAIEKNMYNLALMTSAFQASYKAIIMCYKAPELKDLLDDVLIKFWAYDLIEKTLDKKLKSFYTIILVLMLSLLIAAGFFGVGCLLPPLFQEDRKLPFPVKYSFDSTRSPIYELLYLSHIIGYQMVMVACILGVDCMFFAIASSAVTQYRILQKCFSLYNTNEMNKIMTKLDNSKDKKIYEQDQIKKKDFFVKCWKHHQLLIRFTGKVNNVFSLVILVQLLCSVTGLCLGTYTMTRDTFTKDQLFLSAVLAVGYLDQLMVYCIIGNELNYQANLLPEYIYKCNWRDLEEGTLQKDVMFLIQNAQKVPQLSAYGLYDVNMTSFVKVLKMAFSFYTLLSNLSTH